MIEGKTQNGKIFCFCFKFVCFHFSHWNFHQIFNDDLSTSYINVIFWLYHRLFDYLPPRKCYELCQTLTEKKTTIKIRSLWKLLTTSVSLVHKLMTREKKIPKHLFISRMKWVVIEILIRQFIFYFWWTSTQ